MIHQVFNEQSIRPILLTKPQSLYFLLSYVRELMFAFIFKHIFRITIH